VIVEPRASHARPSLRARSVAVDAGDIDSAAETEIAVRIGQAAGTSSSARSRRTRRSISSRIGRTASTP
jgi:hypothetical protein